MTIQMLVWDRLSVIRRVRVEATEFEGGRNDAPLVGTAVVTITDRGPTSLDWEENGAWDSERGSTVSFHNRLRWTIELDGSALRLAHLRQGEDAPAWLCEFVPIAGTAMRAREPYRCGADTYSAELSVEGGSLVLRWLVEGPRKNHHLIHSYSP